MGSLHIPFSTVVWALAHPHSAQVAILWTIRFPRVAFASLVGADLAVAGLVLQTVLKNDLADPGILGISSGSALGASLILLVLPASSKILPLVAFLAGMLAFATIIGLTWHKRMSPVRLILAGVAVNAVFAGCQSALMTAYSDRLHGVIAWLNGDLSGKTWAQFQLVLAYSVPVLTLLALLTPILNILALDDQAVDSLGIPVGKWRFFTAALAVCLTAATVSQVGLISFVGLIVPHMARTLVGQAYQRLLPVTLLLGAGVVTIADTAARVCIAPLEMPIGTMMALMGGPFFLFLLHRANL